MIGRETRRPAIGRTLKQSTTAMTIGGQLERPPCKRGAYLFGRVDYYGMA